MGLHEAFLLLGGVITGGIFTAGLWDYRRSFTAELWDYMRRFYCWAV